MSTELTPYRTRPLSRREHQTAAMLRQEQLPAKCAAARLQAAALVAHVGMLNAELLTNIEVQMIKRGGAVLDARIAAIVDTYAGAVNAELARLSLGG